MLQFLVMICLSKPADRGGRNLLFKMAFVDSRQLSAGQQLSRDSWVGHWPAGLAGPSHCCSSGLLLLMVGAAAELMQQQQRAGHHAPLTLPTPPTFSPSTHTPSIQAGSSPPQVECWLWPTFDMYLDDRAAATAIMTDRELQFNKEVLHSETSLCHKAFVLGGGNAGKNGETSELGTKPNLMNNGLQITAIHW